MTPNNIFNKTIGIFMFLVIIRLVTPISAKAQEMNVCGIIFDEQSREPLIGATVYEPHSMRGAATDNNGYFCLSINNFNDAILQVSYIGYQTLRITAPKNSPDSLLVLLLKPGISISEITVVTRQMANRIPGIIDVPVGIIKKLPTILGEPDLLKGYQLMPGVKMGDEGSSVFFVRGGTPDQNLTLLDDVPLYYVNHIGGFLSVFDMSTIKKATLYKGYFPPHFGGRLSSVLDIRLKDGDVQKTKKEITVGTLASRFFIEGPIGHKVSGMFSVRRCNLDLLMRPLTTMASGGKDISSYTFYDLTSKVSYQPNARNKLNAILYAGTDNLFFSQKENVSYMSTLRNRWGNIAGSVKWTHFSAQKWLFSSKINFTKFFRIFASNEKIVADNEEFVSKGSFRSKIGDLTFASETSRSFRNFDLKMGAAITLHQFTPSAIKSTEQSNTLNSDTLFINKLNVAELRSYFEANWDITNRFNITSGFFAMHWGAINHTSFDPRIAVSYTLPNHDFIKLSFTTNHQYIHLLSNNSGGIPVDLWIPSSTKIYPEKSKQITLAYSRQIKNINLSVEAYYKEMDNLIYYKPGFNVFNTLNWADAIEKQGKGFSKGIEFLVQKTKGKNTGWLGYTLSKDTRLFENINSGHVFPFKYGRLHEINLVYFCEISPKVLFSADWIFASGNYITLAKQSFPAIDFNYYQNSYFAPTFVTAHYYGGANNFKTAPYHRLDIGFNFKKKLRRGERNLYLGVYNLYNRKNPYYYYYKGNTEARKLYQFSLFPIIPSVSFTYKW